MALTSYFKADNITALNLAGSWTASPAGPPPSATTSQAVWDSTVTVARSAQPGASTTWGKILVTNPGGACTIQVQTGVLITLNPTDPDAAGVGIELTSANAQTFTITNNLALGSSQSWKVAAGRTLDVRGVVSGAFSLTKTDAGTLNLVTGVSTFGTGGGQSFTAAAGLTIAGNNASLGDAANTVIVQNGAAIRFTAASPQQSVFQASGVGTADNYGAIACTASSWANTKTITAQTPGTVLSFRAGGTFAMLLAVAAGVSDITLNAESTSVSNTTGILLTGQSSYIAQVKLTSLAFDGITPVAIKYSIGGAAGVTDARTSGGGGLGDNANAITVEPSGGIMSSSASGTFNRSYTFISKPLSKLAQFFASVAGTTTFAGPLTLSGSDFVHFSGSNNRGCIVKFNGIVSGGASIFVGGNDASPFTDATAEIGSGSDFSGWTGAALNTNNIRYAKSLPNANALVIWDSNPSAIYNISGGDLTVRHSAYGYGVSDPTPEYIGPNNLTMTGPVGGSANWTSPPSTWRVGTGLTLTLDFNFTGAGALGMGSGTLVTGLGTLVLSGNNTGVTSLGWGIGSMHLNSAGSAGPAGATFLTTSTGTLDNTSGSPITLDATGTWTWNANFVWGGSNDLTRNSAVNYTAARAITFVTGKSADLKIGSITATGVTVTLNVGGGVASTSRLWIGGTNTSTATSASVTAGYLRAGNAASLGAVGTTTTWSVANGAAIELDGGITVPATKNGYFIGNGPDTDGALRSTSSGTNKWQGAIQFTNAAGGRIKATDGTTLTLDPTGSPAYTGIDGTSSCPVYLDAGISATLNQDRILASTVGIVYCGNGGSSSGRVVLSKANQHTGVLNCESGTTALTNANAAGPAATGAGVNVKQSARLAVEVPTTYKAVFPGTTALGVGASSYAARAFFRIGA